MIENTAPVSTMTCVVPSNRKKKKRTRKHEQIVAVEVTKTVENHDVQEQMTVQDTPKVAAPLPPVEESTREPARERVSSIEADRCELAECVRLMAEKQKQVEEIRRLREELSDGGPGVRTLDETISLWERMEHACT